MRTLKGGIAGSAATSRGNRPDQTYQAPTDRPLDQVAAMFPRFESYSEFWPFYLRQHAKPATRACHYVGTMLELSTLTYALVTERWLLRLL